MVAALVTSYYRHDLFLPLPALQKMMVLVQDEKVLQQPPSLCFYVGCETRLCFVFGKGALIVLKSVGSPQFW
jgi:hypothetical protein